MELNGNILKLFENNTQVLNMSYEILEPLFNKIWVNAISKTKNENEILYSVCFYDDLLKYQSLDNFNKVHSVFFQLCNNYNTTNQDILQSVIWGFGELARRLDRNAFAQYRDQVINAINFLINKTDAFSEENSFTSDNAISSLTKFVLYQCADNDMDALSRLLTLLPLKFDVTEGCEVMKLVFTQIIAKHPLLVNPGARDQLKGVFSRIQDIRNKEGEFLDDQGLALYIQALNSIGLTI